MTVGESKEAMSSPTVVDQAQREAIPLELSRRQAIAILRGRAGLMLCVALRVSQIPVLLAAEHFGLRLFWAAPVGAGVSGWENLAVFQTAVVVFQCFCSMRIGRAAGRHPILTAGWVIFAWMPIIGVFMAGAVATYADRILIAHRLRSGWMGISQDGIDARWPVD